MASRRVISRLQFNKSFSQPVISDQVVVRGLDFDFDSGIIYWSDVATLAIKRAPVKNGSDVEVIVQENLRLFAEVQVVEGIAVDWINKKLYWTDTGNDRIEVADLNGGNRLILIQSGLLEPRAISVHPLLG